MLLLNYAIHHITRAGNRRILAEVLELPGVMVYGDTSEQAVAKVQALALRVIADKLEHGKINF